MSNLYWQVTHKELVKWKANTEQRLTGILTSLKGVQVPKNIISLHLLRI